MKSSWHWEHFTCLLIFTNRYCKGPFCLLTPVIYSRSDSPVLAYNFFSLTVLIHVMLEWQNVNA